MRRDDEKRYKNFKKCNDCPWSGGGCNKYNNLGYGRGISRINYGSIDWIDNSNGNNNRRFPLFEG